MRKSNLLVANKDRGHDDRVDEDEEEDPLDKYLRELQEQAGVPMTQNVTKGRKIEFSEGETLGNLNRQGQVK